MSVLRMVAVALVALAIVGFGGALLWHDLPFWSGQRVLGTVTALEKVDSSDGPTLYAVVEYQPINEKETRHLRSGAGNPSLYTVGEQVPVVYLPKDPSQAKVHNVAEWSFPFLIALFGIVFGTSVFVSGRRASSAAESAVGLKTVPSGDDFELASKVLSARRNSQMVLGVSVLGFVLSIVPIGLPGFLRGLAITTGFSAFLVAMLFHLQTRRCPRCSQELGEGNGPPIFGKIDDCRECGLKFTHLKP